MKSHFDMVTRRHFLWTLGIGAAAAASGVAYLKSPFTDDYTVLERVSADEIKSLEDLLESGSEEFPDLVDMKDEEFLNRLRNGKLLPKEKIMLDQAAEALQLKTNPQIVYLGEVIKDVKKGIDLLGHAGGALILNNDGFFITAYHVVEEYLEKQKTKNNKLTFMVYDPVTGIIEDGRVLTYSKNYDIALGKTNVPFFVRINPTPITKGNPEHENWLYTMAYGADYIARGGLFQELYGHNRKFPDQLRKELNLNVSIGTVTKYWLTELQRPSWEMTLYDINHIPGHSGSPVFSLNGDLIGIVYEQVIEEGMPYSRCIGPQKIREMLRHYIHTVRK